MSTQRPTTAAYDHRSAPMKDASAGQAAAEGSGGAFSPPKPVERLGRFAEGVSAALILLLVGVIGYEVVARYVFNRPTGFANQIAAYSMPFIALLAAGAALGKGAHVLVDAAVNLMSPSVRRKVEALTDFLSVAVLVAVTVMASLEVYDNWESGTKSFSTVLTFPEYIPQLVMPVGFGLLTVYQLFRLIHVMRDLPLDLRRGQ